MSDNTLTTEQAKKLAQTNAEAKLAIEGLSTAMQKLFGVSGDTAGKVASLSTQIFALVNGAGSAGSALETVGAGAAGLSSALFMPKTI